MESEIQLSTENRENPQQRIIVEIGPNDRPLIYRLSPERKEMAYYAGRRNKPVFKLSTGDLFIEVDLPAEKNVDVFNPMIKMTIYSGAHKEPLLEVQRALDERLPEGIKGEVLYADGQKLPFENERVDVLYMANVMSGHIKGDQMHRFEASPRQIFREKMNLIKEAKRVLRTGGFFIIEEEFAPASSGRAALEKVMENLRHEPDFDVEVVEGDNDDDEKCVFKLTKRKKD